MFMRIVVSLCLLLGVGQCVASGMVRIADGDCAGLSAAVTAAQATSGTTILLARCAFGSTHIHKTIALTQACFVTRDDHALDLARAFVDLGDARVAVVALEGKFS